MKMKQLLNALVCNLKYFWFEHLYVSVWVSPEFHENERFINIYLII